MKRFFTLLGFAFLALAVLSTFGEIAVQVMSPGQGVLLSIADVWRILSPAHYHAFIEANTGPLWMMALNVPGWVLFGVPAFALLFVFRDRHEDLDEDQEHAMYLFDELSKQAREDGYEDDDTGLNSDRYSHKHLVDKKFADEKISSDITGEDDEEESEEALDVDLDKTVDVAADEPTDQSTQPPKA